MTYELDDSSLHIWLIPFKHVLPISLEDNLTHLNEEEKERCQRFVKQFDRERYAISHICLREILSRYVPEIRPNEWYFEPCEHGKPKLSSTHNIPLSFNLTHSANYSAVVLSNNREIGIDIEEPREGMDYKAVSKSVFNNKELAYLNKLHESQAEAYFTQTWTLKEAYLKALGTGFSVEPNTFSTLNDSAFVTKHLLASCEIEDGVFMSVAKLNCENRQNIQIFEYQRNSNSIDTTLRYRFTKL